MDNNAVKISVRNLVEAVMRHGDLDTRFMSMSRAVEGTRIHQKIQKENKKKYSAEGIQYDAEVYFNYEFKHREFTFVIEGRADGVIHSKGIITIIDEIKSTNTPLEEIDDTFNELHWAQAKCYAYLYSVQNNEGVIDIQLTYCDVDTEEIKIIKKNYSIDELEVFFKELIDKYYTWAQFSYQWSKKRDASIVTLQFPFDSYRKGQREMAVAVYRTIQEGKKIFVQAPTGIGKTISTIFPTVKALAEGHVSKIFYLTAKTITRQVAEEAFNIMRRQSLSLKTVTLTAKDKICFEKEATCNPEQCPYAKGHFDKVNDALMDMLVNEDEITREKIESYARSYHICPFEFSLDLTLWADCIICDYNYVFDPRVNLKRFFESKTDFAFLVDECHNLVDRAREMYSAQLSKAAFLKLRKAMKEESPKLSKALNKVNSALLAMKKSLDEGKSLVQQQLPKEMYPLLRKFVKLAEDWLPKNENKEIHQEVLQLYFDVLGFIRIWELYDDNFINYIEEENNDFKLKIFCLHPGKLISDALKKGKAGIFFSATLMPMQYFKDMLGASSEDYTIRLQSPFAQDNLLVLIEDRISTRFNQREKSYASIARYVKEFARAKVGNYMVFFPSYKYLKEVYNIFVEAYPDIQVLLQEGDMDEQQRDEFLKEFKEEPQNTMIAFVVLGGVFSEGIDLKGDRLIGAVIVGVGLPQICLERNIIKDYFDRVRGKGYEYSYMFPGMNKVLQGAGRVIRSGEDRGAILLLDDRYTTYSYRNIFPEQWRDYRLVKGYDDLNLKLMNFWGK